MPESLPLEMHAAVSLGILLLVSLVGGIVADFIRVPKVTAYLIAGVLVGPSVLHWISEQHIHQLEPLTKLAMSLVLLELGSQFSLTQLRPILRRSFWISGGELLVTEVVMILYVLSISPLRAQPLGCALAGCACHGDRSSDNGAGAEGIKFRRTDYRVVQCFGSP